MPDEWTVRIPRDPKKRAALAKFAGLTDEERAAIDWWCCIEEQKRQRGVLMYETEAGDSPTPNATCAICNGEGWISVPDHDPDCFGNCEKYGCPIPTQASCPDCSQPTALAPLATNEPF
jgi:hypothetical protein